MGDHETQMFAADVRQLKDYVKVGHLMAQTAAKELKKSDEAFGTKEREEWGDKLKDSVNKLVHLNYNLSDSFEAYKETSKQIKDKAAMENSDEEEEEYDPMEGEQMFDANFDTIHAKTPTNVKNDDNVKAFVAALGLSKQHQSMGGDDEFQVEEAEITSVPKDPCTQLAIEDPVKNTVCGHLYDRKGIEGYLLQKQGRNARCPTIGCGNRNVQRVHLVADNEMLNLIHRLNNAG
jgi:SUMO ligase MMS21 Smc5/6 complex component